MAEVASTPQLGTWLDIAQVAEPRHVPKALADHFSFCHIRPTRRLGSIHEGRTVYLAEKTVCVILGVEGDRYALATKNGQGVNFSAADVVKAQSLFTYTSIPTAALFDGPWQVFFNKANLLSLP